MRVSLIISDPQSYRLLQLFQLPEFSERFSVSSIDLNSVRSSLFARVVRRGRNYLEKLGKVDTRDISVCEYLIKNYLKTADAVVGLDNQLSLVDCLVRKSNASLSGFVIQMGTNPKYYGRFRGEGKESPVTLFSWGNRETTEYAREGLLPYRVVPVGSLMRALAERSGVLRSPSPTSFDVCIVSQFRPEPRNLTDVSESAIAEAQSMPVLLSQLSPILRKLSLSTIVALRADKNLSSAINAQDEKRCIEQNLKHTFTVTGSENPFSSYSAVLNSRLTIGRNSGLLFETMGFSNRILFVNPTRWTLFDPPSDWPFGLTQPVSGELESTIQDLLNMSDARYKQLTKGCVNRYSVRDMDTLSVISELIAKSA